MKRALPVIIAFAAIAAAQPQTIERAMRDAEPAWNRGDLQAFVSWYDDSPETTFIGREITRGGVQAILDRYRRGYPTREKMGTLTYSDLRTRMVDASVAVMTGRFSLKRTPEAGGDASGIFTLVWKRTPAGWKIIHDHTH